MGLGMGLTMSPMSTAAMNAVDRTKAGVASGVLSMSRMVGGTFGVAVMGALVATIGRSQINAGLPHLPAATQVDDRQCPRIGRAAAGPADPGIATVVREAFVSALGTGLTIGAAVTLVGAGIAATLIRSGRVEASPPERPPRHLGPAAEAAVGPAAAGVGVGASELNAA